MSLPTVNVVGSMSPPQIHRDIKPQNIMRRKKDAKLVLIDFGAAKDISNLELCGDEQVSFTIAIRTRGYMPPEQLSGYPKKMSTRPSSGNEERRSSGTSLPRVLYHGLFFSTRCLIHYCIFC